MIQRESKENARLPLKQRVIKHIVTHRSESTFTVENIKEAFPNSSGNLITKIICEFRHKELVKEIRYGVFRSTETLVIKYERIMSPKADAMFWGGQIDAIIARKRRFLGA